MNRNKSFVVLFVSFVVSMMLYGCEHRTEAQPPYQAYQQPPYQQPPQPQYQPPYQPPAQVLPAPAQYYPPPQVVVVRQSMPVYLGQGPYQQGGAYYPSPYGPQRGYGAQPVYYGPGYYGRPTYNQRPCEPRRCEPQRRRQGYQCPVFSFFSQVFGGGRR